MLKRINHIGIAVRDLEAAIAMYRDRFGVTEWERISLPERHMNVAVCHIGDTLLEFITPTSEEAAFAKYLREKGEGIHHIAYEVAEVEPALRALEDTGVRLIDQHGRPGIHDTCAAFLHPKSTMGVLIELVELPQTPHR
ncbi:MAG TPA: methylmalonyl-CoA epimerase [Herpetosiphonaceae bacterium]